MSWSSVVRLRAVGMEMKIPAPPRSYNAFSIFSYISEGICEWWGVVAS